MIAFDLIRIGLVSISDRAASGVYPDQGIPALRDLPWQQELSVPPLTASMGIALYPQHAADGRALLALADSALFRAKAAQRDRVEVADVQPAA